jgi:hypothetical protein
VRRASKAMCRSRTRRATSAMTCVAVSGRARSSVRRR